MKAAVFREYGPPNVLKIETVEKPEPKPNEIQIEIQTVAVPTEDPMNRSGNPFILRFATGFPKPNKNILGAEFSGVISKIGDEVKSFKVGDRVFGTTGTQYGCYAEFVCMPEDSFIGIIPENVDFNHAAPVCGTLAAWNFLVDKAKIQSGQDVLIIGASGSLGTAGIQIAKNVGANVTGICSGKNAELVKSLGAEACIDYELEDFTKNKKKYDVIFDAASKSSFGRCKNSLKNDGIYLSTVLALPILIQMLLTKTFGKKKAIFSATGLNPVDKRLGFLNQIIVLMKQEKVKTVIDKTFPFQDISEAHKYVESKKKIGNVIVSIKER